MKKKYFITTWRNLVKNKTHSFINIFGLASGLTCFTFISLWIMDELNYDKFNSNYDRIVRLVSTVKNETGMEESATSGAPMAKALKDDYPEVEHTVRLKMREEIITHNNQQVLQPGILLTDPSFFDIFSYNITRGNTTTALSEPYSIILTETIAKKYFGDDDPLGQTLILNMYDTGYGITYRITGIMPDPPKNAHFTFNMLASFKTIEVARPNVLTIDGWSDASFYTYLLLRKGVDHKAFSSKIAQFYEKHIGDLSKIWRTIYFYKLQPLSDIHLHSSLQNEIASQGNITRVYIFSTIGIFILLLAGINYTNLATARAVSRAKEVGIKKVAGADKYQLIFQYLSESVFIALIALLLSLFLSLLLQPFFHQITSKDVSLFSYSLLLFFLLGVTVLLGVLSGLYPAVILSSFKPAVVLKGAFKTSSKGVSLQKTLVVSQFVVTMILITGIIIIYAQLSFIRHKDLGYDKEALVFLRVHGNTDVVNGYSVFKNELEINPLISGLATSNSMIGGGLGSGGAETADIDGKPIHVNTSQIGVDADYFDVYGIKLLAGRNFARKPFLDTNQQIILNETAVRKFGWKHPEIAIGKPFRIGNRKGIVIGVTNDFHYNSLQQAIEPLAITPLANSFSRITLKIDIKKADRVIDSIKKAWKKHFPTALFDYDFLSQQIQAQYEAEKKFSSVFLYFSVLSLLIACLGLYGLISYTLFQKTKEIGIRKVLGATVQGIAAMLSGIFIKLVLLACLISTPLAWYVMNGWLENFAYRIDLSWWMFTVSAALILLVALITVGLQAIKAAVANPVKCLRTE